MMCEFCKQDVEEPCRDGTEVQERSITGITRCQQAQQDRSAQQPDGIMTEDR